MKKFLFNQINPHQSYNKKTQQSFYKKPLKIKNFQIHSTKQIESNKSTKKHTYKNSSKKQKNQNFPNNKQKRYFLKKTYNDFIYFASIYTSLLLLLNYLILPLEANQILNCHDACDYDTFSYKIVIVKILEATNFWCRILRFQSSCYKQIKDPIHLKAIKEYFSYPFLVRGEMNYMKYLPYVDPYIFKYYCYGGIENIKESGYFKFGLINFPCPSILRARSFISGDGIGNHGILRECPNWSYLPLNFERAYDCSRIHLSYH